MLAGRYALGGRAEEGGDSTAAGFCVVFDVSLLPSRLSPFLTSTMPCCGTPATNQPTDQKNHSYNQYPPHSPINQQPSPQPGLGWQEKQYQQPEIPPPPPTHYSHETSHSPPPSNFNSYQPSTFNASTLSGTTYQAPSIPRPPPSLSPSPPLPGPYGRGPISTVSPAQNKGYVVPTDEGKLSVSIDFGKSFPNPFEHPSRSPNHFISQVPPFLA